MVKPTKLYIGQTIYAGVDEPIDIEPPTIERCVVTKVYDDHFIYDILDEDGNVFIPNAYGLFDDDIDSSCVTFVAEEEATQWLKRKEKRNETL